MQTEGAKDQSTGSNPGKKYSVESTKSQESSLELDYFTIRNIKKISGKRSDKLIIIGERESVHDNYKEKPQFEINLKNNKSIADSANKLKVGDIVSTTAYQYNITITRPDKSKQTQTIYRPARPFSIVKKLEVKGRLGMDPAIRSTDKGEVATLRVAHLGHSKKGREVEWRLVAVLTEHVDSVRKLKKGDPISVEASPKTYFNTKSKSNDIIWQAKENVKKLEKEKKQTKQQGRGG